VGWLVIDGDNGTVAIPGWERRFSKSAKNRAMHAIRADDARTRTGQCAKAHASVRKRAPERRDRGDRNSSSSQCAARPDAGTQPSGWETLRTAWKAGKGRPWALPTPPDKAADRLSEDGWFEKALAAIDRLPQLRYFVDPVTLPQFVAPGFVDKILGGQFDNPREQRQTGRPDDRPPPQAWTGEDAARLEATRKAMIEKLKELA